MLNKPVEKTGNVAHRSLDKMIAQYSALNKKADAI